MALILEARGEGQLQFQPYRAEQRPTLPRNLDGLEELEHVSLFDVVEVLHADTALESFAHRADVVPEAFQGGYVALVDYGALTHHANAVVAEDLPARDVAAGPYAAAHDVDPHLVCREPGQRLLERLHGTGDISLDDEVEVLGAALTEQLLQGTPRAALRELLPAESLPRLLGAVARDPLVAYDLEAGSRLGDAGEAEDLDRHPRSCLVDTIAHEVEHGPYPAVSRTSEHGIALLEGPATEQQRGHRTASRVALPLYNVPARGSLGVRLEVF